MLYYRAEGLRLLYCSLQCAGASILLWIWLFALTILARHPDTPYSHYLLYTSLVCFGCAAHWFRARHRSPISLRGSSLPEVFRFTFQQALTVGLAILVYLAAAKDQMISRLFLFTYLPLLFLTLFLGNKYLPRLLSHLAFHGPHQQRTIVVGSLQRAQQAAPWLITRTTYGIQTIGLITPTATQPTGLVPPIPGIPILGNVCEIEPVLKSRRAVQVILLELPSPEEITYLRRVCEGLGIRLLMLNDLPEKLGHPLTFAEDDGVQVIAFRQEPLQSPLNRLMKRGIDIAISLPVVVFVLPLTNLLVYLFQRIQAPGPLFFRQPRTGFQNEEFQIYKYRTMCVGHGREATQATTDDPRIYPAGRWLRKHSLDELPQFINVLKGEMSIVGPRPHMPEHSQHFSMLATNFGIRSFVKPGITGLAQVEGLRGETKEIADLTRRVRSDLYYLENWSFLLEWFIILKTAVHIVRPPKEAY